jgi:uncharacterized LabA/DUF88 family protein
MIPFIRIVIPMKDTYVYIDGAYLSVITKHFGKGKYLKVDIKQLAIILAQSQGFWCKKVYLYLSPPFQSEPPTEEEEERRRRYDKFINKLKKIPDLIVREGRCQKIEGDFHQKGVDTLVTMDLFEICYSKDIETVILLACDTDFIPIIRKLQERGKRVILFYYSDYVRRSRFSMSNHILNACDECVLLTIDHLRQSKLRQKK